MMRSKRQKIFIFRPEQKHKNTKTNRQTDKYYKSQDDLER